MYGRQVKVRESVEKVFKPEYIAVQGTSETGTRSDGTMVNCLPSLNEQKRMGLGRSEDVMGPLFRSTRSTGIRYQSGTITARSVGIKGI